MEARNETAVTETQDPVVNLTGISQKFGRVTVLREVDLALFPGEVVGMVGDNGAGKSTLVKIISGYNRPTSGTMTVRGKDVAFRSPREARAAGIETVYQDLAIIDDLSLWRNFFLGRELSFGPRFLRILKRGEMRRICAEHLDDIGLVSVRSPDQLAKTMSGGERQSLAISRATHFESVLLILDEPVAALSVRETRRVLEMIERARSRGLSVLYIDHNMSHVQPVADRIVVIEHGKIAQVIKRGDATVGELSDLVAQSGSRAPVGNPHQEASTE